jgi:hypothetical protein
LGIGHGGLGMADWALGIGHWAFDQEFQRWYKPPDLSVESIPNPKSKIENPQAPAFIRGVNLKSKI